MNSIASILNNLTWGFSILLLFVGCASAFSRRATLLGLGLGLFAFSMLLNFVFNIALQMELLNLHEDSALFWFWPLNNIFMCGAALVIVIGVLKIPKAGGAS